MSSQLTLLSNQYNTLLSQYQEANKKYMASGDGSHVYELQKINNELVRINTEMVRLMEIDDSNHTTEMCVNSKLLQDNYRQLEKERAEIERMLREHHAMTSVYEYGVAQTSSAYYQYIVYVLVVLLLLLLWLKFSATSGQLGGGGSGHRMGYTQVYLGILMACIVLINAYIKTNANANTRKTK